MDRRVYLHTIALQGQPASPDQYRTGAIAESDRGIRYSSPTLEVPLFPRAYGPAYQKPRSCGKWPVHQPRIWL